MKITDITRTIYSIGWPETKEAFAKMRGMDIDALFSDTWTKKQDNMHVPYLKLWRSALEKYTKFDENKLKFGYPTNGSSESISNQIHWLNAKGKRLVVFESEYEGYVMIAKNVNMPIHVIKRENYMEELGGLNKETDVFFLSQPSAIEGCYWQGFNDFMNQMENLEIDVYVDLTYAGVFEHPQIDLTSYKCVAGVFFSLSKLFGVYYHRIGGCFLREENSLLWPMLWFKNLHSIQYAIILLNDFREGKYEQTRKNVKRAQQEICKNIADYFDVEVIPSDVPMIAMMKFEPEKHDWMIPFKRSENPKYVRVCISSMLEKEICK